MDDGFGSIKVIPDHFQVSTPPRGDSLQTEVQLIHNQDRSRSSLWSRRKFRKAASMLNLFSLRGLPWSDADGQEKIQLTAAELESLRSELADIEEREAYLKAQLEHIDEILRSARLSGYLYIRTRWTALPGEPAPVDDIDMMTGFLDLLFFMANAYSSIYPPQVISLWCILLFYLSPQDSTLLSHVVEVGSLPSFVREDEGTQYAFYILTCQGLRYECSHVSKVQVDTWLSALQTDCKLGSDVKVPNEGRAVAVAAAAAVSLSGKVPLLATAHARTASANASRAWLSGVLALPMADGTHLHCNQARWSTKRAGENGIHQIFNTNLRCLLISHHLILFQISEIISRSERKGFKLVAINGVFPEKLYDDLKERPFFNGLCEFLSSGPVLAMFWEGEGVIKYGRKLIGATDPQKSEPGTIGGDLAVVVGRNIIHGSDGPETAKDETNLWFKPQELLIHHGSHAFLLQTLNYPTFPKTTPLSRLSLYAPIPFLLSNSKPFKPIASVKENQSDGVVEETSVLDETLLSRVSATKDSEEGLQMIAQNQSESSGQLNGGVVSVSDCRLIINAALDRNNADLALWKWSRPDVGIYTTLVQGLAALVRVSDALRIIDDVCRVGVSPSEEDLMLVKSATTATTFRYFKQRVPSAVHSILVQTPSGLARTHRFAAETVDLPAQGPAQGERVTIACAAPSNVYREVGPFKFSPKAPNFYPGEPMCLTNHKDGREPQLLRAPAKDGNISIFKPQFIIPLLTVLAAGDAASGIIDLSLPKLLSVAAVETLAVGATLNAVIFPQLNQVNHGLGLL
ncbi:Nucleoside diphosphate kinase IV [Hibiscus syriacus]|uniref:Nucleoside diphosphate kinase IV n=1 Tax=Hibiscus syriacus TaxID=106335 RepID=A0A6A2XZ54_HIBSY|nr:Nucleoside diphosphate kinase IV [Hibiscus syriacus]